MDSRNISQENVAACGFISDIQGTVDISSISTCCSVTVLYDNNRVSFETITSLNNVLKILLRIIRNLGDFFAKNCKISRCKFIFRLEYLIDFSTHCTLCVL